MDVIDHDAAAQARLAQFLKGQPNFLAFLAALTARAQELEVAFHQLLEERTTALATGVTLDKLGAIVGQERASYSDAEMRVMVAARILVNRSSGTTPEILTIFETLNPALLPVMHDEYRDIYPAAFRVNFLGSLSTALAKIYIQLLRSAKAAGVRGLLEYGEADAVTTFDFAFDSGNSATFDDNAFIFRGTLE